ncbi:hypothetical protein LCGC14_2519880 [marine sediment metagenome]|uniref:Uncharacterized protein n=1 Tax=marine sediment metagenome TaxID=412755 RepID=A0A0F9AX42_9ZZZZ
MNELRLILCICLLVVVEWAVPVANREGQIIFCGLVKILKSLNRLRDEKKREVQA